MDRLGGGWNNGNGLEKIVCVAPEGSRQKKAVLTIESRPELGIGARADGIVLLKNCFLWSENLTEKMT